MLLQPIRTTAVRICILEAYFLSYLIFLFWVWKKSLFRYLSISLLFISILALVLTTKDKAPNRIYFIEALKAYKDTVYVWGGENKSGIDCSGLIRMSMRDAYIKENLWGNAFLIWFFDVAARDFKNKYTKILINYGQYNSIRKIPDNELIPGSIVVTANGIHTFAYLGDHLWVQASPNDNKVTIKNSEENDPYFNDQILIYKFKTEN